MTDRYTAWLAAIAARDATLVRLALISASLVMAGALVHRLPVSDRIKQVLTAGVWVSAAALYLLTALVTL